MKNWFRRFFTIQASYADMGEQQLAQRLLLFNLVLIILNLLAAPLILLLIIAAPHIEIGAVFVYVSLMVALINHRLIQHGSLRSARYLFVLNLMATTILALLPDYRIDSPLVIILTLPLTAAGLLLRRSGLLYVVLFLSGTIIIGGMLQIVTDMEATPLGETATANIRTTILAAAFTLVMNTIMLWTFGNSIEKIRQEQKHLASLVDAGALIGQKLITLPDSGEELNQCVEELREAFDLYHVQIYLVDAATDLPVLRASTGFIGRRLLEEESLLTPDQRSPVNEVFRQVDPLVIFETSPEERRTGFLPATRSELLLPLRVGALRPMGVLDLHSAVSDTFSSDVLKILVSISGHLAVAIYAAQQAAEVRTNYRERDQLIEQIGAAQREVARANRQLIGATWGTYLGELHDAVFGFNWQNGVVTPLGTQPSVLKEADGQPRLEQREGCQVLVVPIRLRGQVLGELEFSQAESSGWSSYALELAEAVAERLALSLENARLFEQAQTTARREQLVSQITANLQSSNDLQSLLTVAAVQFQDALGATRTQVRLGIPSRDQA